MGPRAGPAHPNDFNQDGRRNPGPSMIPGRASGGAWSTSPAEGENKAACESKDPARPLVSFNLHSRSAPGKGRMVATGKKRGNASASLASVFGGPQEEDPAAMGEEEAMRVVWGQRGGGGTGGSEEEKKEKARDLKEEGNALAESGSFREAMGVWEEALALTPNDAILLELKAQGHLQLEEWVDAVEAAKRASELAPEWLDAKLTLGRAYLSLGEVTLAMQMLTEVCGKDPGHEEAREDLMHASHVAMELTRRRQDLEKQVDGRAGLTEDEMQVARCKLNLLVRGKDVRSDCWLGRPEDGGEEEEEEEEDDGTRMQV